MYLRIKKNIHNFPNGSQQMNGEFKLQEYQKPKQIKIIKQFSKQEVQGWSYWKISTNFSFFINPIVQKSAKVVKIVEMQASNKRILVLSLFKGKY